MWAPGPTRKEHQTMGRSGAQGPPTGPHRTSGPAGGPTRRSQCLTLQLERANGIARATHRRQASGRAHERAEQRLWRASGRAGGQVKTEERWHSLTRVWLRSQQHTRLHPLPLSQQPRSGTQAVARFAFTAAQTEATATALVAVELPYSHAGAINAVHTSAPAVAVAAIALSDADGCDRRRTFSRPRSRSLQTHTCTRTRWRSPPHEPQHTPSRGGRTLLRTRICVRTARTAASAVALATVALSGARTVAFTAVLTGAPAVALVVVTVTLSCSPAVA